MGRMKIGYARVSTDDQTLDLQLDALARAECELVYQEHASGKNIDRQELEACLKGSAGRSILKPVPTGFSSRQGTTLPFGRPAPSPLDSNPVGIHRSQMTLRRSLHLAGFLRKPARCLGYAGAWKTSRHCRKRQGFVFQHSSQQFPDKIVKTRLNDGFSLNERPLYR
jgi:hypothetical protein